VHKIIKGAKPEQLPPTKFKFVINLKTAKAKTVNRRTGSQTDRLDTNDLSVVGSPLALGTCDGSFSIAFRKRRVGLEGFRA
jgi:hypothetical protein